PLAPAAGPFCGAHARLPPASSRHNRAPIRALRMKSPAHARPAVAANPTSARLRCEQRPLGLAIRPPRAPGHHSEVASLVVFRGAIVRRLYRAGGGSANARATA